MGSLGSSDWEEEVRGNSCISKRLKIPKKFSDDFIPVDYALVPRKLRSAKKRSSGSVSPQLLSCKKHNRVVNGDELSGKNGLKKLKLSMEQGISERQERHVFITKDEEEVAETLYALADMFHEIAKDKTKLADEPSKSESEAFCNMEMLESGVVLEKETEIRTISGAGTKTNSESSIVEGSAEGVKIQSLSDGSWIKSLVKTPSLNFHAHEPKTDPPSTALSDIRSSTSKFTAIPQSQHLENSIPKKVASEKPWKKCCTHVHVSNLINELKKADSLQMQSTQAAHFEELRGAFITSHASTENTNNVFPLVSTSNAVSSAADTSSDEIRNAVLLHKRLLQDQQLTVSASQNFTLQNLNLELFPLPARGARGESSHGRANVDQCSNGRANVDQRLGSVAQPHLAHLRSKYQHMIPFVLPPNYYSTDSSSGGGTTVAQQVQFPSYQCGRNYAPPTGGVTATPKQQTTWQPQLQQNWCDQLRENWKAGKKTSSNIRNWQNGVQDGQSLLQFAPLFSSSHSSLGVFGENHAPRHQQQQPSTMPTLFLHPSRKQGQPHLHYDFQGSGRRHPDSVQPALQFL